MVRFTHGGATGDIIFSLPTIRQMGGGELYITKYDEQRALSIAKLIEYQDYITSVHVVDSAPDDCVNLNKFREHAGHHHNLVEAHFKGQGLPIPEWKSGWLKPMPAPAFISNYAPYCIINRTTNYADPNCDWKKEVEYLQANHAELVYFIGYRSEYDTFQSLFDTEAKYLECDFLEAAYLIYNAKMFTGCYSAMSTIAMGLGINYRLEQAPGHTCSTLFDTRETIINL